VPSAHVSVDTVTSTPIELDGPNGVGDFIAGAVERFEFFELVILNTVVDLAMVTIPTPRAPGMFTRELRQDRSNGRWTNRVRRVPRRARAHRRAVGVHATPLPVAGAHGRRRDLSGFLNDGVRLMYKVIQWATGGLGQAAIEGVITHPETRARRLLGAQRREERARRRRAHRRRTDRSHATNDIDDPPRRCRLRRLLPVLADPKSSPGSPAVREEHRVPVGWWYPQPDQVTDLEAACAEGGVTLHGTGIPSRRDHRRFPLMVSALSNAVTRVRAGGVLRHRTYAHRRSFATVMPLRKSPEEARTSIMTTVLGHGFKQSVRMVAAEMGFAIEPELRTSHEVAVATAPHRLADRVIEPARLRATLPLGRARRRKPVIIGLNWFMGQDTSTRRGASP